MIWLLLKTEPAISVGFLLEKPPAALPPAARGAQALSPGAGRRPLQPVRIYLPRLQRRFLNACASPAAVALVFEAVRALDARARHRRPDGHRLFHGLEARRRSGAPSWPRPWTPGRCAGPRPGRTRWPRPCSGWSRSTGRLLRRAAQRQRRDPAALQVSFHLKTARVGPVVYTAPTATT